MLNSRSPAAFLEAFWRPARTLAACAILELFVIGPKLLADDPAGSETSVSELKQLSIEQLMNLEVTSVSREPEKLIDAASAIQIITNDEIENSGATSIPDALRLADNLDIAQKNSSAWAISARGFNASVGNKLLVLMDGRSIYTPLFSGVIWGNQDYLLADIDRIEVISGPGGTQWGANAVNGVINITSKSAKDTQGLYAETGGGTGGTDDFAAVRFGGVLAPNIYYRVYAKYFDQDSENFSDGSSAGDAWRQFQAGFRVDSDASLQNRLTLQGDAYGTNTRTIPGGEGTPQAEGISSGGNVLGRWTHTFADDSDITLQAYYDYTHLGAPFQSDGAIPPGILFDDLDTYDVDLHGRFPLGPKNHVVWGFGYRYTHDVSEEAPLVAFLPSTLNQSLISAFAEDEVKLLDNVSLTLGTKLEHNDFTGIELSPSIRFQWNITDRQMLWSAVSRAVRTPSRYERNLYEPSPQFGPFLAANPDYTSENLIAYELGYRTEFNSRLSGSVSLFYNEYDDIRSLGLTPSTVLPLIFQNTDAAQTYGVEFSADYQVLDSWRIHLGYDLLKEWVWTKPGQVDLYNDLNETSDPENQVSLRSSWSLSRVLSLDAALRWVDTLTYNDNNQPGTVPSYYELNARVAWQINDRFELSLAGENLLHKQHVEFGAEEPVREAIRRTVYGKAAWRF